jgi:hypothetical protein
MGKRSPQTFIKRQREMDKKRKNEEKRRNRAERSEQRANGEKPEDDIIDPWADMGLKDED